MKKRILILCLLLSAALLASCGKSTIDTGSIGLSITPNASTAAADEPDAETAGDDTVMPEDTPDAGPEDTPDAAPLTGTIESSGTTGSTPASGGSVVTDTVEDGTWPASCTLDSWNTQNSTLTVTLYRMDLYAAESIESLKPGSSIVISGKTVKVETVTKTANGYDINGGLDKNGVSLVSHDAKNYRVLMWDDHATFTSVGTYTLKLSSSVVLKDSADYNTLPDGKTVSAAELASYLSSCEYSNFNVETTTITVKNGEITEVVRGFMP